MQSFPISRRSMLQRVGTGLGVVGLAGLLKDDGVLGAEALKAANPLASKAPPCSSDRRWGWVNAVRGFSCLRRTMGFGLLWSSLPRAHCYAGRPGHSGRTRARRA